MHDFFSLTYKMLVAASSGIFCSQCKSKDDSQFEASKDKMNVSKEKTFLKREWKRGCISDGLTNVKEGKLEGSTSAGDNIVARNGSRGKRD